MEFSISSESIAKLVLGYLKSQGCKHAFKEFLKSSPHLRQIANNYRKMYISTRVRGLTLIDLLYEYAEIYTIIETRLEYTSYYTESKSRQSLVEQLLYLLEHNANDDRGTPTTISRRETPQRELINSDTEMTVDNINSSPLEDLPGYDAFKAKLKTRMYEKRDRDMNVDPDISILTQTLLENHELHEKIAENINLVRNSTEGSQLQAHPEESSNNVSHAVDSAIKAIVEKTEKDPAYEKLINEIIGVGSENKEHSHESRKNVAEESAPKCSNNNTISARGNDTIDHQNCEAIQSLIAAASVTDSTKNQTQLCASTPLKTPNMKRCLNVITDTGEIILFDGTLDNYVKTNANNNNLLMIQPDENNAQVAQSNAKNAYILPVTSTSTNNVQFKAPTMLTEQDIIKMPTVILCENTVVDPASLYTPIDNVEAKLEQQEFITMYQAPSPKIKNLRVDILPPLASGSTCKSQLEIIANSYISNNTTVKLDIVPSTTLGSVPINFNTWTNTIASIPSTLKESTAMTSSLKCSSQLSATSSDGKSSNGRANGTPKTSNESHVRKLDFNFTSPSKTAENPVEKKNEINKSKCVQSLFRIDEVGEQNTTPTVQETGKKTSSISSWDADLRRSLADLVPPPVSKPPTKSSRKKARSKKKSPPKESEKQKSKNKKGAKQKGEGENGNGAKEADNVNTAKVPDAKESADKKSDTEDKSTEDPDVPEDKAVKTEVKKDSQPPTKVPTRRSIRLSNTPKQLDDSTKAEAPLPENEKASTETSGDKNSKTDDEVVNNDIPEVLCTEAATTDQQSILLTAETTINLRKINAEPRYNRKCNISNNFTKKEVHKLSTPAKELKHLEFTPDNGNKLILSPSKLNANKRDLLEVDADEANKTVAVDHSQGKNVLNNSGATPSKEKESTTEYDKIFGMNVQDRELELLASAVRTVKHKTPELKPESSSQPITHKKSFITMLETPSKGESCDIIPKTPGMFSPLNIADTPLTRVFKEHTKGINLSEIPSPKFPLTPIVPLTPMVEEGVFPARSTDYSTSSSYYQPSDSEENKCLELLTIEERSKRMVSNSNKSAESESDTNSTQHININKRVDEMVAERVKSVMTQSRRGIGSKNLKLLENDKFEDAFSLSESEESFMDKSDSTFVCTDTEFDKNKEQMNKVHIGGYCLRARNTPRKVKTETKTAETAIVAHSIQSPPIQSVKNVPISKNDMLKELEEKRQKTITNLMNADNKNARKLPLSLQKIKNCSSKSKAGKKAKTKETNAPSNIESNVCNSSNDEFAENSSSSAKDKKSDLNKKSNKNDKSEEAGKLVAGLKEMGILLIPNDKNIKNKKSAEATKAEPMPKPAESRSKNRRKAEKPRKKIKKAPPSKEEENSSTANEKIALLLENERRAIDFDLEEKVYHQVKEASALAKENEPNLCEFGIKVFDTENLHLVHDDTKQSEREPLNTSLDRMKKGMLVSVYVDKVDDYVDRYISLTNFDSLFDLKTPEECDNRIKKSGKSEKSSSLKRKATVEVADTETKKSKKHQEFLKKIGVECVLVRLHGNQ